MEWIVTARDDIDVQLQVDSALQEVLGYVPAPDDDLTSVVDSLLKLELLVVLEQKLAVPFEDEALAADWWSSRNGITTYVKNSLSPAGPA